MKVPRAIEILGSALSQGQPVTQADLREAIELAVKALERHNDREYTTYAGMHEKLEGED